MISRRLSDLRQKLTLPYVLQVQDFLTRRKRILFALGLFLPRGWLKNFLLFATASVLVLGLFAGLQGVDSGVRFSKQILGTATTGLEMLQRGKYDLALKSFKSVQQQLQDSNEAILKLLQTFPVFGLDTRSLQTVSTDISAALDFAVQGLHEFENARLGWDAALNASDQQLYLALKTMREDFLQSSQKLGAALELLQSVNTNLLPAELAGRFAGIKGQLEVAYGALNQLADIQGLLLNLLGGEPKTYLLIFQNNNEARAAGGFIGTYGLLEFSNGRMKLDKIESIYALDGQLQEKIAAPGPLERQVSPYWGLRDSNWFVDFPKSSQKILAFLEKENGAKADGVISFTPDVFEKLLPITGPVAMPEYGVTLTSENFRETVQYKTSLDYDKQENQPKKFLSDFAPLFLGKLQSLDKDQWLAVFDILSQMAEQKQLLMYSRDPELQAQIRDHRLDGGITTTDGDYLAIYHSNVGGGKTDRQITQKVEKQVSVISGGLAIVNLRITRTNQAYDEKFFPKNLDFMRILVPRGAKLLAASGFDDGKLLPSTRPDASTDPDLAAWDQAITHDAATGMYIGAEADYTEFSNWLELLPGQSKTVSLRYEVALPNDKVYTSLLQKQPGAIPFEFVLEVNYLAGRIAYTYPENLARDANKLRIAETVSSDRFYGIVGE